jgi:hypothetical protein
MSDLRPGITAWRTVRAATASPGRPAEQGQEDPVALGGPASALDLLDDSVEVGEPLEGRVGPPPDERPTRVGGRGEVLPFGVEQVEELAHACLLADGSGSAAECPRRL